MYSHIASNSRKSILLVALFVGILAAAGYVFGYLNGSGYTGLIFALVVSLGMTAVSWFWGDKIVLMSTGAKRIESRDQNTYLWNMVENLSITAGVPMPKLFIVDDPAPNAFATGRDPARASIAVTTGIVSLLENEELEGVLAHELSHVKNYDMRFMMLVAVLVGALTILGDSFFRFGFLGRGRGNRNSGGVLALVGIAFLILSPLIGELIKLAVSRSREYLADASGALMTRYPEGLARALEKISAYGQPMQRASQATAHLWIASPFGSSRRTMSWFSTHPPVEDRVNKLRLMADAR
ncbi:M48 family metalloprotease [Candidatus Uhrbacteria bacterium]|nr:M48 family metalloprotease [Candidatus Uhrbacteria bacterium]